MELKIERYEFDNQAGADIFSFSNTKKKRDANLKFQWCFK